ncbi:anti-sigma factor family protein [Anoxynatronum buryatiense]|uniref:Zinc-finger domain-containing protein n=1 Tax=Anoxynatronum buryatiense TaxID=489973 RepID=A0AA45WY52_9CLOT|nr:hypothetical protein [Anoxynatronum buryatiense]SMP67244.1 hypothetical protein SAMN06296020_11527 [Anoxynatronum buryatiense]
MDCRTSSEIMIKQMDGPLAEADMQGWQQHLSACTKCRKEAAEWQQLSVMLARLPDLDPSPGFERRVMAAIDPMRYAVRQPQHAMNLGMLFIWIGIVGGASLLVVEAAARMQQWMMTWFQGTALYRLLAFVYEFVVIRGIFYFLMPQKGLWDWLTRWETVDSWWVTMGTLNLVMVLVLIKVILDRILAGGRGEVR